MGDVRERLTQKRGPVEKDIPDVGKVWIRRLTVSEMLAISKEKDKEQQTRRLVAEAVVEQDGGPVFKVDEINALDWPTLVALSEATQQVNSLSQADAEKNSQTPPS